MSDKEIITFLQEQINSEKRIVESIKSSVKEIKNIPVNSTLTGISMDSSKHAHLYAAVITLLEGKNTPLEEEDLDTQRNLINEHILFEEKMINKLEKFLPQIDNPKAIALLNSILTDERKHHKMLKELEKVLLEGETITEDDWWEAIWKDVPGLWT
jgi:rubrerythrin